MVPNILTQWQQIITIAQIEAAQLVLAELEETLEQVLKAEEARI